MEIIKDPSPTFLASLIQAGLYERFGEYALIAACNPFKNYSDVRDRVETFYNGRLKAATMCVGLNHKGTESLQVYVCS
ncbi:hypothetical protein ACPV5U_08570 [Vibrio mediterranei]